MLAFEKHITLQKKILWVSVIITLPVLHQYEHREAGQ